MTITHALPVPVFQDKNFNEWSYRNIKVMYDAVAEIYWIYLVSGMYNFWHLFLVYPSVLDLFWEVKIKAKMWIFVDILVDISQSYLVKWYCDQYAYIIYLP